LEGLEIKEKKLYEVLSNKDFRIDSSFYTKEPKKNPNLIYAKIGEHLISSQYGISIEMNTDSVGYPIYRMNEIHDMLCDLDVDKCADITQAEYDRFALKNRDVLFNRTNSFEWVGRTGIYYQNDDIQRTFASYLVRLNPKDSILPEYLCAYLNCKYGEWDVKRRARQSINQTNVNPEEVKEIEIPILNIDLQRKIQECFTRANSLKVLSKTTYSEAELILHEELDIDLSAMISTTVTQKRFSDFVNSGRLDAEYYQPKYDKIETVIQSYKGGSDVVSSFFTQNKTACTFDKQVYKYIEIGDINIGNGEVNYSLIPTEELPANAKIIVNKGDLLVSKVRPYRGAVAIVDFAEKDIIASGAFTVLQEKQGMKKEVLQVLLRTSFYKDWLLKWNVGSSYPVIKDDDILNLLIPKISENIQRQIAAKVQESFTLKAKSKRLLNLAKTAVETAIERGESAALRLLD
jgi:type I restriction enzyme S subunit